jgi:Fic family protein
MPYNWQHAKWPNFDYEATHFDYHFGQLSEMVGESHGLWQGLATFQREDAIIELLVQEALKTSAIESEMISKPDLISSIRRNLGYPTPSIAIKDQAAQGIAELMVRSRETFADPLTETMLFDWHRMLMRGNLRINIGQWRSHIEPMQLVSGAIGREQVHFEAPASTQVPNEMKAFLEWFNGSAPGGPNPIHNPIIRSAIAHLYFESIHPFEDGNGRIGRVIAEKTLSQHFGRPVLMSLSSVIEVNRKNYYSALQAAQSKIEANDWIAYFGAVILAAQRNFHQTVAFSLKKPIFLPKKVPC